MTMGVAPWKLMMRTKHLRVWRGGERVADEMSRGADWDCCAYTGDRIVEFRREKAGDLRRSATRRAALGKGPGFGADDLAHVSLAQ